MAARRCSMCGVMWPVERRYFTCVECGASTWHNTTGEPIPLDEANRRRNHALFQKWLDNESTFDRRKRRERYRAEEAKRQAEFERIAATLEEPNVGNPDQAQR